MAKRRSSGEGNIRKRSDGRWEGRYVAGHDANGKPIRKNVLGKTQAEVKEKLKKALEESHMIDVGKAEDYTVEKWVRTWYEIYSKPNLREATQERYWNHIQYHIIPEIGQIKLTKLTSRDIQTMYNNVRDHGRVLKGPNDKRDKSLSASYIGSLHRMLKMCLERAVKEQLLVRNPCDNVVLPKEEKKEIKILKPDTIGAYLAEADRRGVLPMFYLELCSGLRRGELVALLWTDLDTTNNTISVTKQAVRVKGGGVKTSTPKTATSIRREAIPQEAVDLLIKEHEKHPNNPYMFPSPVTGGMYYPDSLATLNEKILKACGLEYINFHALRHTFATVALQSGVDIRTVSGMLGHADPGFTLRTYTHATNPMQVKAAATVGSVMASKL
ncbi:MAG: site-specific integrase [Oscillospiraceae bacterium]|nr:site-specific integrase [Oscillospiraceae bacterium]